MTETLTIGRRLVPLDHIALVEPFDPATSRIQTERPFKARVVMLDRESVLTEDAPTAFVACHQFRLVSEDEVATNPSVRFQVEHFMAAEGFQPTKPYKSRLIWRDQDGNTQSKLLLAPAEAVLAAVQGRVPAKNTGGSETTTPEAASRRKPRHSVRRTATAAL